jgi:hypothetical protein
MTQTDVTFFATPEEQRAWLLRLAGDPQLWWLASKPATKQYTSLVAESIQSMPFTGRSYALRLYVGHKDLSPSPVWRQAGSAPELDFIRSRAIQVIPSLVDGEVLLEGHVSIMRPADYQAHGVAFQPLHRWFREVCESLEQTIAPPKATLIVLSPTEPPAPSRRKTALSKGAAAWKKGGGRLKQFSESVIEFDLPGGTR